MECEWRGKSRRYRDGDGEGRGGGSGWERGCRWRAVEWKAGEGVILMGEMSGKGKRGNGNGGQRGEGSGRWRE